MRLWKSTQNCSEIKDERLCIRVKLGFIDLNNIETGPEVRDAYVPKGGDQVLRSLIYKSALNVKTFEVSGVPRSVNFFAFHVHETIDPVVNYVSDSIETFPGNPQFSGSFFRYVLLNPT